MAAGAERTCDKVVAGGTGWARWCLVDWVVPHLCVDKLGGATREWERPSIPVFQREEIKPQNIWPKKPVGTAVRLGETPSLTREFIRETHRILEYTQTHPPGNQHQKGPICLSVAGGVTESEFRAEQAALFPPWPLPHIQCHNAVKWVALPWKIPKAPSLIM